MRTRRRRRALLFAACATLAAGAVAALVLVVTASPDAESTRARYLEQVASICRAYGPRLDVIRPPDVAEPANVIDAVTRALPLLRAQQREVRTLDAPAELRDELARWLVLQDRRLDMLDTALEAAGRQDFRALGIAYVDFMLAGSETARLGRAIGIPHPPC